MSTPKNLSHKKACEMLLSEKYGEELTFKDHGTYGDEIPEKFDTIFIRMAAIINGISIIYYPK